MTNLTWRIAGTTDRGYVRKHNEDSYFISKDTNLYVVADGMGGAIGGALASKLAVESVQQSWEENPPQTAARDSVREWLVNAVHKANLAVVSAQPDGGNGQMGTTIVAALRADDGQIEVAHVGDSRAYLVRDGKTKFVTRDHSVVMEMFHRGQLTMEQCRNNDFRHLITRCLGHDPSIEVDVDDLDLVSGDWLILASDGLSAVLDDDQVAALVHGCTTPDEAVDKLLAATLEGGGPDNVTILAAQCLAIEAGDP